MKDLEQLQKTLNSCRKNEVVEMKLACGLHQSSATAYLRAHVLDGGCGMTSIIEEVQITAIASFIKAYNSRDDYVRGFTRYACDMYRELNKVEKQNNAGNTFLDWKTAGLKDKEIDQLIASPDIINTIRTCRHIGARVILFEDEAQFRIYVDGEERACRTGKAVRSAMRAGFRAVWREEIKGLKSDMASNIATDEVQRRLANLWRTEKNWPSTIKKFAVRMCADVLPDAKNLNRWCPKENSLVCTACATCWRGNRFGDLQHIFHSCPATSGLISTRHNNIVEITNQKVKKISYRKSRNFLLDQSIREGIRNEEVDSFERAADQILDFGPSALPS